MFESDSVSEDCTSAAGTLVWGPASWPAGHRAMGWGGACACWHRQAAAGQLPQTCGTLVPIAIVAAVCVMQCVIGSRQLNGLHGGVTIGVIVCAKTLVGWAQAQHNNNETLCVLVEICQNMPPNVGLFVAGLWQNGVLFGAGLVRLGRIPPFSAVPCSKKLQPTPHTKGCTRLAANLPRRMQKGTTS